MDASAILTRPVVPGPYDYTREVYTRLLWVVEGATSYYDDLILRRAGLITPRRYLEGVADRIRDLENTPARRLFSLSEASFDTWLKMYQWHENFPNNRVSFYLKGALVHLLLDLELRRRTDSARCLDDVLRRLWADYAARGVGFPEHAYRATVEAVADSDFDEFWARYVDGVAELDFDAPLASAGLRLTRGYKSDRKAQDGDAGLPGAQRGYLGVKTRRDGAQLLVDYVLRDTPAWQAGLTPGDELLALDGVRVTDDTLVKRLDERRVGETVTLSLFRRDELRHIPVTLGQRPPDDYRIEPLPEVTDAQRAFYRAWLHTDEEPAAP